MQSLRAVPRSRSSPVLSLTSVARGVLVLSLRLSLCLSLCMSISLSTTTAAVLQCSVTMERRYITRAANPGERGWQGPIWCTMLCVYNRLDSCVLFCTIFSGVWHHLFGASVHVHIWVYVCYRCMLLRYIMYAHLIMYVYDTFYRCAFFVQNSIY